jgi:hypothetical protein
VRTVTGLFEIGMTREEFLELGEKNLCESGFSLYGYTPDMDDVEDLRAACLILARLLRRSQEQLSPL